MKQNRTEAVVMNKLWGLNRLGVPGNFISNVANALLTVSSCKNHKKYFAIKWIISLFRCVKKMQATFTIPFSGSFITKAAPACPSIITISTITIITG